MRLEHWLKREKVTQTAFAEAVGTTDASLSRIVAGTQWPSAPLMAAIEAATNGQVTASDILATCQERRAADESEAAA